VNKNTFMFEFIIPLTILSRDCQAWREINEGGSVGEVDFVQGTVTGQLTAKAKRSTSVYELRPKDVHRFLALNCLLKVRFWKCFCQFMELQIILHQEYHYPGSWCILKGPGIFSSEFSCTNRTEFQPLKQTNILSDADEILNPHKVESYSSILSKGV
jgi:hypothetical protein